MNKGLIIILISYTGIIQAAPESGCTFSNESRLSRSYEYFYSKLVTDPYFKYNGVLPSATIIEDKQFGMSRLYMWKNRTKSPLRAYILNPSDSLTNDPAPGLVEKFLESLSKESEDSIKIKSSYDSGAFILSDYANRFSTFFNFSSNSGLVGFSGNLEQSNLELEIGSIIDANKIVKPENIFIEFGGVRNYTKHQILKITRTASTGKKCRADDHSLVTTQLLNNVASPSGILKEKYYILVTFFGEMLSR